MRYGLLILFLCGCDTIIGADDGSECTAHTHCPSDMVCDRSVNRCRQGQRPEVDAAPLELDAQAPDAAVIDAAVDQAIDVPIDAALPDLGPTPFGPEGECFTDEDGRHVTTERGSTHVPRAWCTPQVLAWTAQVDGALELRYQTRPDQETPETLGFTSGDLLALEGDVLLRRLPEQGFNVERRHLSSGEAVVLSGPGAHLQAARAPGLSAVVEAGSAGREVRLFWDDDTEQNCAQPEHEQWGVAAGRDWIAFFEKKPNRRIGHLVLTREQNCRPANRIRIPLTGAVAADAQLVSAGDWLLWIETGADRRPRVAGIERSAPGVGSTEVPPLASHDLNPVELVARGRYVGVANYRPGGHEVVFIDLESGALFGTETVGNALQPNLSQRYLTWAEQNGTTPWEIRYVALP